MSEQHKAGDLVFDRNTQQQLGCIVHIVRAMETGRLEYDVDWGEGGLVAYDSRAITLMKRDLEKECSNAQGR